MPQDGVIYLVRRAEPAKVVGLRYIIFDGAQPATFATVRLQLNDPAYPLCGHEIEIDIPPSTQGEAEAVVARSRFDASFERGFRAGERCKVRRCPRRGASACMQCRTGSLL